MQPTRAQVSDTCRVPDVYLTLSNPLQHTRQRMDGVDPFRILVIGPSIGEAGIDGRPGRLERELERRLPDVPLDITQARGQTGLAEDDFDRIRDVFADSAAMPDLVIWQTGVSDAIASSNVDRFGAVVDRTREWIEARGVDVILVDPPFVPNVSHEKLYWSYVGEIGSVSEQEDVPVFRRYATMKYWELQREKAGRPLVADDLSRPCVAEIVAEAIYRAVTRQVPPRQLSNDMRR